MNKYFLLFVWFIMLVTFDSAYAATSEDCGIFEIRAGCDLSGWLKVIFGVSIGGGLAILLHYLAHRTSKKLDKNRQQLKEHTLQLKENSIAIQKILDSQEYARNRRRDFVLMNSTSHFNAILLRLGMMNRIIQNKQNLSKEEQYSKLESEESEIQLIIEKLRNTLALAVDIIDPMLYTQLENFLSTLEDIAPSKNKDTLEFSDYEKNKEKMLHLRDRLKEFITTKEVLK